MAYTMSSVAASVIASVLLLLDLKQGTALA